MRSDHSAGCVVGAWESKSSVKGQSPRLSIQLSFHTVGSSYNGWEWSTKDDRAFVLWSTIRDSLAHSIDMPTFDKVVDGAAKGAWNHRIEHLDKFNFGRTHFIRYNMDDAYSISNCGRTHFIKYNMDDALLPRDNFRRILDTTQSFPRAWYLQKRVKVLPRTQLGQNVQSSGTIPRTTPT